jgi:hypothetical protein
MTKEEFEKMKQDCPCNVLRGYQVCTTNKQGLCRYHICPFLYWADNGSSESKPLADTTCSQSVDVDVNKINELKSLLISIKEQLGNIIKNKQNSEESAVAARLYTKTDIIINDINKKLRNQK